jgi:hypothetical protein
MLPGVYSARKKNGEVYYRSSITYRNKHISLGSYTQETSANMAYLLAGEVLESNSTWTIENYPLDCILTFDKWVALINFRDNGIYFKNPIYLKKRYFFYYIDKTVYYTFDAEDLFYYAHHKIMKRGGHLFVSDFGMQVNILSRYGIKNFAVVGRDYSFMNGDSHDFRYHNIELINRYYGVSKIYQKGIPKYVAKIHLKGNFIIGCYSTETEAAIAYNKAVLLTKEYGITKNFPRNYIDGADEITYAALYQKIRISKKLLSYLSNIPASN